MNRLTVGQTYKAVKHMSGTGTNGEWELLTTEDADGRNPITVFPMNHPCGIEENAFFRIDKIKSTAYTMRKGSNDRWFPSISVTAMVVPAEAPAEAAV